jgi:hypothetical protein
MKMITRRNKKERKVKDHIVVSMLFNDILCCIDKSKRLVKEDRKYYLLIMVSKKR